MWLYSHAMRFDQCLHVTRVCRPFLAIPTNGRIWVMNGVSLPITCGN